MNKLIIDDSLTDEQIDEINRDRDDRLLRRMREMPEGRNIIHYTDGLRLYVEKNVFWPHYDSFPLVKNMNITRGDSVLDLCTGSGVIAIIAAQRGANRVVAVDINPAAVRSAKINAVEHGYEHKIDVRKSNLFSAVGFDEYFNVITANTPFTIGKARDNAGKSMFGAGVEMYEKVFYGARRSLVEGGKLYLANANFGAVDEMLKVAEEYKFNSDLIGRMRDPDMPFKVYYAFEFGRRK